MGDVTSFSYKIGDSFASFEELETALEYSEKKKNSSFITVTHG